MNCGLPVESRDLAMKREILIDRVFAAADGGVDRRKAVGNLLDLRRRSAFGGKPGRLHFDAGAQFHDVEHLAQRRVFVEIHPERPPHLFRDEGADALAGDHQAVSFQGGHRFAHHSAAHARGGDHFLFRGQPRAGRQFAADDAGGQPGDQFPGQPARGLQRLQQRQIF